MVLEAEGDRGEKVSKMKIGLSLCISPPCLSVPPRANNRRPTRSAQPETHTRPHTQRHDNATIRRRMRWSVDRLLLLLLRTCCSACLAQ